LGAARRRGRLAAAGLPRRTRAVRRQGARHAAALAAAGDRGLPGAGAARLALRAVRRAQRERLRRAARVRGLRGLRGLRGRGAAAVSGDVAPGIVAVTVVTIATLAIGTWALRFSRTTSDFFVASRTVRPGLNASAISGEYLSAASFLGVAGLVLTHGADMLWYPIGWTAGYLLLLVFVAAPLRRSGAYTIPDFAQVRLQSLAVRRVSTLLVVGVGWLYLLPQFQGAGLTLQTVLDVPRWVGTVLVAAIVTLNVVLGGMRSITFVQAFQYWLKLTALLVPLMFLLLAWSRDGRPAA